MITIGSRTVKTAVGSMIALFIAQLIGLENASTAAVVTLLSVQSTKKQSVIVAIRRLAACLFGIGLAVLLFEGGAYTPIMVGVFLFIFIPAMAKLRLQEGIVPGFVIVMQLFITYHITLDFVLNQIWVLTIGILVALVFNLYMPSVEKELCELSIQTEDHFKAVFVQLARFIRKRERVWNDEFVYKSENTIKRGLELARRSVENSFFRKEEFYLDYFTMRKQQMDLIERVIPIILNLPTTFEQNEMVADFVEGLGFEIYRKMDAVSLLDKLREMRSKFEQMELPKTREEFETRAALLVFINELERFIQIETDFHNKGLEAQEQNK